ncbi:SDR family oxidoreductase [Actinophytocola sp.]|uniref:SDR family oxidoreductase n=1 Tax=Actinophytocola sp. TaxID=1872138 RepID=UPI00389A476A
MTRALAPGLLKGDAAVVTGGASGIGLGIARHMAALGADVVISGRSADRLATAAATIRAETGVACSTYVCDVRAEEQVAGLRDHVLKLFGTVTILVNNAAANFEMPAERMTSRAFTTVVDVDLVGTFLVTRALVADMISQGGGAVLNIVVPDAERGFPGYAHSGAAKAGIISLTRSWAREWGVHQVRVNALGPGPVPTEGVTRNMLGLGDDVGRAFAESVDRIPLGRLGTVDDVAVAGCFLCSRAAAWITGVSLNVDGGMNVA